MLGRSEQRFGPGQISQFEQVQTQQVQAHCRQFVNPYRPGKVLQLRKPDIGLGRLEDLAEPVAPRVGVCLASDFGEYPSAYRVASAAPEHRGPVIKRGRHGHPHGRGTCPDHRASLSPRQRHNVDPRFAKCVEVLHVGRRAVRVILHRAVDVKQLGKQLLVSLGGYGGLGHISNKFGRAPSRRLVRSINQQTLDRASSIADGVPESGVIA